MALCGRCLSAYPGLQEQLARVKEVWKIARDKAKAELAASVQAAVKQGDQQRSRGSFASREGRFPWRP